jgi:predicted dehydrogenase
VEKPFTLDADEADRVFEAAKAAGKLVCVGHDNLFDPIWEECRQIVRSGRIGRVVHVDSMQGYDLGGPFGKVVASEPSHWVHRMPGGLFQNVMSHALYRITDFLSGDEPRVWATWFNAPAATGTATELRVMILEKDVTANLVFSCTVRPVQRLTRVCGTRGSIEVDMDGRTIRSYRALRLAGAFGKIEAPFHQMREATRTLRRAVWKFVRSDIHYFAGMNRLIRMFYSAVLEQGEPPIPYRDIRYVTSLMDQIFSECRREDQRQIEPVHRTPSQAVPQGA